MKAALDSASLSALTMLREAFPSVPLALVGAAALGCHIPMRWRRTEDVDLVVAVPIESATSVLSALPGWRQNPRKEHEWRAPRGAVLDILPVSEEALASRVLVWPGTGARMSLVGMRHALAAPPTRLGSVELAVPSVPVMALLKMVSYLDRPYERERDLSDLAHILDEYPPADDDRLFAPGLIERGLTMQTAPAFVLGREVAALVDETEGEAVRRFVLRVRGADLGRFVATGPWSKFEPEEAESRLEALAAGLGMGG